MDNPETFVGAKVFVYGVRGRNSFYGEVVDFFLDYKNIPRFNIKDSQGKLWQRNEDEIYVLGDLKDD